MCEIGDVIQIGPLKLRISETVARGGMATVYRAAGVCDGREYAVKSAVGTHKNRQSDEASMLQLENETAILEYLSEKGCGFIPKFYGGGKDFYAMEFLEGKTLDKAVFSEGELIRVCSDICDMLTTLHEMNPGIIYRDLKPSNVFMRKSGELCLIDFGTAIPVKGYDSDKSTGKDFGSMYAGTRGYAAPEQYGGLSPEDARTDIYQLGKMIIRLLDRTDHRSYIAEELYRIAKGCSERDRKRRYTNCREVKRNIEGIRERVSMRKRRDALCICAGAFATGLICGGLIFAAGTVAELKNTGFFKGFPDIRKTLAGVRLRHQGKGADFAYDEIIERTFLEPLRRWAISLMSYRGADIKRAVFALTISFLSYLLIKCTGLLKMLDKKVEGVIRSVLPHGTAAVKGDGIRDDGLFIDIVRTADTIDF